MQMVRVAMAFVTAGRLTTVFGLQIIDLKWTADAIANQEAAVVGEGLQNRTLSKRNAQTNKSMTMFLMQKKLLLLLLCFWPRVVGDNSGCTSLDQCD